MTEPSHHQNTAVQELVGPILTIATAISLIGLLSGTSWVTAVLLAAVINHLLLLVMRLLRLPLPVAALGSAAGLALLVTWTHYQHTTYWALPTTNTASNLGDDIANAWENFGNISTPTDPTTGFVVSAMAALWVIAFFVDWATMRAKAPYEALFFPICAMAFVGVVGDGSYQVLTVGLFLAALLLLVCVHRVANNTASSRWLGGHKQAVSAKGGLLAVSGLIAVVGLSTALVTTPVLQSNDKPIIDLTDPRSGGSDSPRRVVISPLVDIRSRLVNRSELVMFEVQATQRSYWRLTALDQFDGQVWTSKADYASRPTQLPSLFQSGSTVQESTQNFTIKQLGSVWLPAAFEPQAVTSKSNQISYEASSSTLIVDRSLPNSNNLSYTVQSLLPRFDPDVLRAIPLETTLHPQVSAYTTLPGDFSPLVQNLAAQITSSANSGYEQALALQDYFRNGSFIYDDNVGSGHSIDNIEDFLVARRGYCEQFASTFAAMARAVGLPTRVAVGFTVGENSPDNPTQYFVKGKHAHAWPEVYLEGTGWVAFEPTPGRGAPNAENYTGLVENQTASSPLDTYELTPEPASAPSTPTEEVDLLAEIENQASTNNANNQRTNNNGATMWWVWAILCAGIGLILVGLGVPFARRLLRRRRFLQLPGSREEIKLLWAETTDALGFLNIVPKVSETHGEFALRATQQSQLNGTDLYELSQIAAVAAFSSTAPNQHQQELARKWAMSVSEQVRFHLRPSKKLLAVYLPAICKRLAKRTSLR